VEFLTHDISVHVPHHVNSKIPWYNLRAANESLKSNWGEVRPPSHPRRRLRWLSMGIFINGVIFCRSEVATL
jgi:fatty acid desaturase